MNKINFQLSILLLTNNIKNKQNKLKKNKIYKDYSSKKNRKIQI